MSAKIKIRWAKAEDVPDIVLLEHLNGNRLINETTWKQIVAGQNTLVRVATLQAFRQIVAYSMMIIMDGELQGGVNVHPGYRREGVGSQILRDTLAKCLHMRPAVVFHVRETNLPGHLFLQSFGFRAVKILKHSPCDIYRFELPTPRELISSREGVADELPF